MENTAGAGAGAGAGQRGHLDASGTREVVFCHQCENEWWQDEHGLVCPRCEGEIIEIVDLESDPRPDRRRADTPPEIQGLRDHNPWDQVRLDSDPDEMDIEEHVTHNPNGSMRFTRTIRSMPPSTWRPTDLTPGPSPATAPWRGFADDANNPEHVMRTFQGMVDDLVRPQMRHGQTGRSGPDTLYNPTTDQDLPVAGGFRIGNSTIFGGRVTYTTGEGSRTQNFGSRARGAGLQDGDLPAILGSLFGGGPDPTPAEGMAGMPPILQGLFRAMIDPANARSGDAVYTQEALDQIISTLMDQHTSSNAPGPASASAIAALPKKQLSEKELGLEGKGECSVCMDDVKLGDEVVALPCAHWFHETCASMWLGEHNTCPICRKGIEGAETPRGEPQRNEPVARAESRVRRMSLGQQRARSTRENAGSSSGSGNGSAAHARNEARLDAIRNLTMRSSGYGDSTPPPRVPRESRPATGGLSGGEGDYGGMPGTFSRRGSGMSSSSGRERDRDGSGEGRRTPSRRSSQSGSGASGIGIGQGGVSGWFRNRFGGGGGGGGGGRDENGECD